MLSLYQLRGPLYLEREGPLPHRIPPKDVFFPQQGFNLLLFRLEVFSCPTLRRRRQTFRERYQHCVRGFLHRWSPCGVVPDRRRNVLLSDRDKMKLIVGSTRDCFLSFWWCRVPVCQEWIAQSSERQYRASAELLDVVRFPCGTDDATRGWDPRIIFGLSCGYSFLRRARTFFMCKEEPLSTLYILSCGPYNRFGLGCIRFFVWRVQSRPRCFHTGVQVTSSPPTPRARDQACIGRGVSYDLGLHSSWQP